MSSSSKDKSSGAVFVYEDPRTGELFHFSRKGVYRKNGRTLVFLKKSKGNATSDHILNEVEQTFIQHAEDSTTSDPKTGACWEGYERVPNTKKGEPGSCRKIGSGKGSTEENWDEQWAEYTEAAEYQGKKVTLNKPFLTPDGPKKRSVYVKNDKGNVVKVNFGDPNMKIKKNDPERRKSFRARHKCDTPGPKWKARYWSCKMW